MLIYIWKGDIMGETVKIKYTKSYDNTFKRLKRFHKELMNLEKIISIIKNSSDIKEVLKNPLLKMYGLEQLKYELNEFYAFNLEKNGGRKRLIVKMNYDLNQVELIFVSFEHYADFSIDRVKYYDE